MTGALEGDWDGLVVLHAANSWDSVKFADQHLAEALSKLVPVLYVDPPISVMTPLKRPEARAALNDPRLRLLASGLARLTPRRPPWHGAPGHGGAYHPPGPPRHGQGGRGLGRRSTG